MNCQVCGLRVLKTRDPKRETCHSCGKTLCPRHAHLYVDSANIAINRSARPTCAICLGMVTVHCFWRKCGHIVEHQNGERASRIMQEHYDVAHEDDLAALGFGGAS